MRRSARRSAAGPSRPGLKLVDCPIRHMGTEKAQAIYLAIERYLQEHGVEMYFGYECSNLILEDDVCKGVAISDGKTDLEIYARAHRGGHGAPGGRLAGEACAPSTASPTPPAPWTSASGWRSATRSWRW